MRDQSPIALTDPRQQKEGAEDKPKATALTTPNSCDQKSDFVFVAEI